LPEFLRSHFVAGRFAACQDFLPLKIIFAQVGVGHAPGGQNADSY